MALVDVSALEDALARRAALLVPDDSFDGRGLIPELAESWTEEDDLAEALEFLCRRYLEELQHDVMLETREKWPATRSGETPMEFVVVDPQARTISLGYAASDEVFNFDPILIDDYLLSG
jgi:hypothetical protein